MKEKFQIIIFAGFLVLAASLFRVFSGPFYFGNNSDPSYFYFYNFLYILEGKSPQFVDHPGSTLDMLGALVVKIFFNAHAGAAWFLADTQHVERVLGLVWVFMILPYAATLVWLGVYVFEKSRDRIFTALVLFSGLWMIIIPSFSARGVLPISANVNSDTMMMTAVNLMLLAMMRFYFSSKPKAWSQAVVLGAAAAFAMATKFTALPFLVVAFCMMITWPQRILTGIVVSAGFILLTCPIWGSYSHMMSWVKGLIFSKGMHGTGGEGFDGAQYLRNVFWVIKNYWFFVAGWLAAGLTAIRGNISGNPNIRRLLLSMALGGLTQIIIVAKQPSYQYMAPMIGLSSLVLAFLYKGFPDWWERGLKAATVLMLLVCAGLIGIRLWQVNQTTCKTQAMLDTIARDYAQCRVCPVYRSSAPGFAFVFWNRVLNREDYSSILKTSYPDLVYYDIFGHDFKDSSQQVIPLAALRQQASRVLIYGSNQDPKNFEPDLTVRKIYTNGGSEALYEVISARSTRAKEFFQMAMILYSQGRYEDALKAAVISRQLGLEQDISGFFELLKQKIQGP
jgi:hypothetical protein